MYKSFQYLLISFLSFFIIEACVADDDSSFLRFLFNRTKTFVSYSTDLMLVESLTSFHYLSFYWYQIADGILRLLIFIDLWDYRINFPLDVETSLLTCLLFNIFHFIRNNTNFVANQKWLSARESFIYVNWLRSNE